MDSTASITGAYTTPAVGVTSQLSQMLALDWCVFCPNQKLYFKYGSFVIIPTAKYLLKFVESLDITSRKEDLELFQKRLSVLLKPSKCGTLASLQADLSL
ncbi:hypothetical protein BGZ65_012288, partial [Modicella reniformis]